MHSAALVVAHASVLTEGLAEHATVIFPAESHAEKEGTLVHPDGRLQRQRIAIAYPGEVRAGWWVLTEIAAACGLDTGVERAGDAFAQLVAAVPFYEGLTLEEIGGHGVRWPERPQAQSMALAGEHGSRPPGGGRVIRWRGGSTSSGEAERCRHPTATCASGPTARSGPRPSARSRRR